MWLSVYVTMYISVCGGGSMHGGLGLSLALTAATVTW